MRFRRAFSALRVGLIAYGLFIGQLPILNAWVTSASAQSAGTTDTRPRDSVPSPNQKLSDCAEARAFVDKGNRLRAEHDLSASRQALDNYAQARLCWQSLGLAREEADVLRRIGEVHFELGEYQLSQQSYQSALAKSGEVGDLHGDAEALTALGMVHIHLDAIEKSLDFSARALFLSRQIADPNISARALDNMGFANYMSGDFPKASDYLDQALVIAEKLNDQSTLAEILLHRGYLLNDSTELIKALDSYQRSLTLWASSKAPGGHSRTLAAIGGIFTVIGETQKALDYNQQALAIQQKAGDRPGQAITFNNIGYTYETLGDPDRALENYLEALTCYQQLGHKRGEAQTTVFVGNMYRLLGNHAKAWEYYGRGRQLSSELKDKVVEAFVLNNMGLLLQSEGKLSDSISNYHDALLLYQAVGDRRGEVISLNNLGYAREALGDKQAALKLLLQAETIVEVINDRELELLLRYNVAHVESSLLQIDQARAQIEAGLKLIESLRVKLDRHELRTSYFASVRQYYDLYIDLLMQLHKQNPATGWDVIALGASERARARSLLELLNEVGADIHQGVDPLLLTRKALLESELNQKAQAQIAARNSNQKAEELAALDTTIRNLTREYQEIEGKIRAASPGYKALSQPNPLDASGIQQQLDSDTLLLEYTLGEARSFVWAVTRNSVRAFELPDANKIEAAARRVVEAITSRNREILDETPQQWRTRLNQADAEYSRASAELSKMVLDPVAPLLGQARLLIVADGALQLVPFAALPTPRGSAPTLGETEGGRRANVSARFLIEDHEIVSSASASVLAIQRREIEKRQRPPHAVAVIANPVFDANDPRVSAELQRKESDKVGSVAVSSIDAKPSPLTLALRDVGQGSVPRPLPLSRDEAEAIIKLAPRGEAMLALNFEASRETAMSSELPKYRIVHFATHGLINLEHPELSGIILSLVDKTGKSQDGFLRLHEIYNLNLPVDLVVLSACETGIGKQIKGEGPIALTRGFMYAGAAQVLASLWKVDDEATAELMGEFYKQVFANKLKPAAALRAAQVKMLQKGQRSPYFWAAFVLQGDWK
jgi:CHAT domain-containing protein